MPDKGIGYELRTLEIVDLFIGPKPQGFNGEQFHFDIKVESRVNPEKKILFAVTTIIVRDFNSEEHIGRIVTALGFDIENFNEIIVLDNKIEKYVVPDELEIILRTISISTTRGVMFSQFKGTHLHRALLPVIPQLVTPQEFKDE